MCYNKNVKTGLLKIRNRLLISILRESQIVTDKLAQQLSKIIAADIHAAVTGLAAPGGSETRSKPVGNCIFLIFIQKKNI
jgi:nicotinamide-nucleotide amidase